MKLLKATWNLPKYSNSNWKEALIYFFLVFSSIKNSNSPPNRFVFNSKFCGAFKSILTEHIIQLMISVITNIILQMKKLRL